MKTWFLCLLICGVLIGCQTDESPTGVAQTDVEGVWVGSLSEVTLLGRTLSGDADWRFQRRTFEIQFFDPPPGQAEQLRGDWKFSDGKMVMTLQSSFPIAGDVGTTDSLFVSILNNQMSLQTENGSNILLQRLTTVAFWQLPFMVPVSKSQAPISPIYGVVSRNRLRVQES